MDEILSKRDLIFISGFKSNKKIQDWLIKNRIPHILSGEGLPLVNRQALAHIMGAPTDNPIPKVDLNFDQKGFN